MLIEDMSRAMIVKVLEGARFGHIACAQDDQPYLTPFYFAYHQNGIYSFATVGKKIEWMRANRKVCVQTHAIVSQSEWQSVVIMGQYNELLDEPAFREERVLAHSLLSKASNWWQPGYVKTKRNGKERPLAPVYFRISLDELSGHQGKHQAG